MHGIEWRAGRPALLFVHDPDDDAAIDSWGFWPDRFHTRGYRVLAIDNWFQQNDELATAIDTAATYLRSSGSPQVMIIVAGRATRSIATANPTAAVLLAPDPTTIADELSREIPKLIIGGSVNLDELQSLKTLVRACRGWALLSTFAVANHAATLLASPQSDQIESQIVSFFQEFRSRGETTN